jgi:hypothetical protein
MSSSISLGDLRAAYRRTSGRILEDGYDFSAEHAIIETLDRDALIIDAAFFVLIFGQIENLINELAAMKVATEARRRALREQKFEKRMELGLSGSENRAVRNEIAGWYGLRNDAGTVNISRSTILIRCLSERIGSRRS